LFLIFLLSSLEKSLWRQFHVAKARISSGPWASSAPKRRSKIPSKRNSCSAPNEKFSHTKKTYYNILFYVYIYILLCFVAVLLLTTVCSVKSELLLWVSPGRLTAGAASYNARQVVKEATDCKVLLHEP